MMRAFCFVSQSIEFSADTVGKHAGVALRQPSQANGFDRLVHSFRGFGFNDDRTPEQSLLEIYFGNITQLNFIADGVETESDPLKNENAIVIGVYEHGADDPGGGITAQEHPQSTSANGKIERR